MFTEGDAWFFFEALELALCSDSVLNSQGMRSLGLFLAGWIGLALMVGDLE